MTTLLSPPSAPRSPRAGVGGGNRHFRRPAHARRPRKGQRTARIARSRWARLGLPALAVAFLLVAVAALAFPIISNLYAGHRQKELASQLDNPALAGQVANGTVADGKPIGQIIIPAIGLKMLLVQGVDTSALESGPGHYPTTPMPCTVGDASVAGHRTTFLHPFYLLNDLKPGDLVEFRTAAWSCDYTVWEPPFSVLPTDTAVVANTPGQYTLTLTTCTPPGSSSYRLVVKAVMEPSSLQATSRLPVRPTG